MRSMIKKCSYLKIAPVVFLITLLLMPVLALSAETYKFERMWPTLQQPWYFTPFKIAIDKKGFVYVISNSAEYKIKKFTLNGQFVKEWSIDSSTTGIAIDIDGFIYTSGSRINKFSASGELINEWNVGSNGVAVDISGFIYVTDLACNCVKKLTSDGELFENWGSYGTENGYFDEPRGIVVDNDGFVYVSDGNNCRIQKFTSDGGFVSKWGSRGSGDGEFGWHDSGNFGGPEAISIDNNGFVYVTDPTINHRIQRFNSEGKYLNSIGNFGVLDGQLWYPYGVAISNNSVVYAADNWNLRVQQFNGEGEFVNKWESGSLDSGKFKEPEGITIDKSGNIYVTDTGNHRVQKFTSSGEFIKKWGIEGNLQGSGDGEFDKPKGIAIDKNNFLYVADSQHHRIQKFTSEGQFVRKWGNRGNGDGEFEHPVSVVVDGNDFLYVVDQNNHRIQKFTSDGQFVSKWGSTGNGDGEFNYPSGIAIDGNNLVYVCDYRRIQKFTLDGQFIERVIGEIDFGNIWDIDIDENNDIYAVSADEYCFKLTSDGQLISRFGRFGSAPGDLNRPTAVGVSTNGKVYVTDKKTIVSKSLRKSI